ncbi:hypothetical protein GF420_11715 [candidate division GN15 bacterium]|nr:hypothetical protein [candidate division GN15 bacterium]
MVWTAGAAAYERLEVTAALDAESMIVSGMYTSPAVGIPAGDSTLHFRLYPNQICESEQAAIEPVRDCGVQVDSVFVNGRNYTGGLRVDGNDAFVILGPPERADSVAIRVVFHATIPEEGDRFGYDAERVRLESWLPVPAPRSDDGWMIIDYDKWYIEPCGDLFDYSLMITVPDSLQVIGPGIGRVDSSDGVVHVQVEMDRSLDVPLFMSSHYRPSIREVGEIRHTLWYREGERWMVDSVAAWVDFTLRYLSDSICAYPFDEFVSVIGAFDFDGALELPRMIWLPSPGEGSWTGFPRVAVVHETIHQWFFGMLYSNQAWHPWLDESITQYFTGRIVEDYCAGRGSLIDYFGLRVDFSAFSRMQSNVHFAFESIDDSAGSYRGNTYFTGIYGKGAEVVGTLVGLMGPEREDEFWREYVATHAFTRPSPEDLYVIADRYLPDAYAGLAREIVQVMVQPDYAITELSSSRADSLDADSQRVAYFENTVRYTVSHPVSSTLPMRLVFDGGLVLDTVVATPAGIHELTVRDENRVTLAIIDPDTAVVIDENYFNNSLSAERVNSSGLRLFSGLTFLVESLHSMLWGW